MSGGVYTTNLIKSLGALTDVDSDNRKNGQAPVYNLSGDIYEHKTVATTPEAGITGAEGDVIICDGAGNIVSTDKINITATELTIDPIRTFDTLTLSQPYVIQYNDTTKEVVKNPDLHIRDTEMRDIIASRDIQNDGTFTNVGIASLYNGQATFGSTANRIIFGSPNDILSIDLQNRRVGIGILDPEEDLEIDGSIQIDSANVARLKFQKSGASPHALGEIDGEEDGANGGDLQFYTKVDGGSVTEKMRIKENGRVGIGTTSPASLLDVNGDINCNEVFFSTNGNDTKIVNNSFASISNYAFAKGLQVTGSGNLVTFTCGVRREGSATFSYPSIESNRFLQLVGNTYINYNTNIYDHNFYVPAGKSIRLNGTAIATAPSDDRIKFNETLITDGLDVINQINIYRYDKVYEIGDTPKEDPYKVEIGAIAQELQQIPQLAQAVSVNPVPPDQEERFPNGVPMSVYYDQLFSYNIRATQELYTLVKSLQARIEVLEGQ